MPSLLRAQSRPLLVFPDNHDTPRRCVAPRCDFIESRPGALLFQFLQRSFSEMSFLLEAQQFKLLGEHAHARAFDSIYGKYLNDQRELLSREMLRILSTKEQRALYTAHDCDTSTGIDDL